MLILHILRLSIPSYMDGHVKKEIFKRGSRPDAKPVKYGYATEHKKLKCRYDYFITTWRTCFEGGFRKAYFSKFRHSSVMLEIV